MKKFSYIIYMIFLVFLASNLQAKSYATGKIINKNNEVIGEVKVKQATEGVLLYIKVRDLPAGKHGLHFHEIGQCNPDDGFASAGGHIMPSGKAHGFFNSKGPHEGNLPNLYVTKDGTAEVEFYSNLLDLNKCESEEFFNDKEPLKIEVDPLGMAKEIDLNMNLDLYGGCRAALLLDNDGSTLIIHEKPDDHYSQPIGGSGARIACSVIR